MYHVPCTRRWVVALLIGAVLVPRGPSYGSDHLDTPTVIADPAADIGDIYAWTAADGRHVNLVMDIVGCSTCSTSTAASVSARPPRPP